MGMSMFGGKRLTYIGKNKKDSIGLDTEVKYSDQHGRSCYLDMRKLIEKGKLCKQNINKEFFAQLEIDIKADNLLIGFPVIDAMNRIAEEFEFKAWKGIMYFDKKKAELNE